MSNRNGAVRFFGGGINSAAYWVGTTLLSASHVLNDSSVTGTTVKDALNYLSTASSAVFPFVASGLAEKDLVSYDAGAATWRNRTKAAALSGTGANSFVVGTGSFATGDRDIMLGLNAGASAYSGSGRNIGVGEGVLQNATTTNQNAIVGHNAGTAITTGVRHVVFGNSAMQVVGTGQRNTALGFAAMQNAADAVSFCVAVGNDALVSITALAGQTVAVGVSSLFDLTDGAQNTGVGFRSGKGLTTGARNSFFGFTGAAAAASSATASDNTFIGNEIGSANVGSRNSVLGSLAFNSASAAVTDVAVLGYNALTGILSSTAPSGSVAIGSTALQACTTGLNTAIGFANQLAITTGTGNVTLGYNVMSHASTTVSVSDIVGIGANALSSALTAAANGTVAIGSNALFNCTSGTQNVAVGFRNMIAITTGARNTTLGYRIMGENGGANNMQDMVGVGYLVFASSSLAAAAGGAVAVGSQALTAITSGARNAAVGFSAGSILTTGSNMTLFGYNANADANSRSGCVVLGSGALATVDDTLVIRMGNTVTKEIVITPVVSATPPTGAVTYLPMFIGGTEYRILLQVP